MLYFLYGDKIKTRKNLNKHLDSLVSKKPDAEVFRINKDNFSKGLVSELLSSQGLFSKKYIVVLDTLFEKTEIFDELKDFFDDFKKTEHIFLCIENKLPIKNFDFIKKYSEKVWEFEEKEEDKKVFNVFGLANYLGNKDKKNLWINYLKALNFGISGEEIVGVLFWQMKNIVIVKKTKSIGESKLSPFVYKNATAFSKKWEEKEILDFCKGLVSVNQKVRDGNGEVEILLEKLILEV